MRTAAALGFLLAAAGPVAAQAAPYVAEVVADSAALRSGPGDSMPDTGSVFRGNRVVVDHDEGDKWVAVQPPRGQVSWIRNLNVGPIDGHPGDTIPRNMIVHTETECEIAFGKPGVGKPLDVRRTRVPEATIVQVIGKKVEVDKIGWLPIEPPDGDFRYLPKTAVRRVGGAAPQGFAVKSPKPDPDPVAKTPDSGTVLAAFPAAIGNPAGPTTTASNRPADWPNHPTWHQAEQAERAGDYVRAEQLYLKLAADMNRPGGDGDLANLCYTRVHGVREKAKRGAGASPVGSGGTSREALPVSRTDRTDRPDPPIAATDRWTGPGALRLAAFKFDGKPTFALVGPRGKVIVYAIPAAGVDLEQYRGRGDDVELFGTLTYPGDLRGVGIMTATEVRFAK